LRGPTIEEEHKAKYPMIEKIVESESEDEVDESEGSASD
jgi:hypothetical protein